MPSGRRRSSSKLRTDLQRRVADEVGKVRRILLRQARDADRVRDVFEDGAGAATTNKPAPDGAADGLVDHVRVVPHKYHTRRQAPKVFQHHYRQVLEHLIP